MTLVSRVRSRMPAPMRRAGGRALELVRASASRAGEERDARLEAYHFRAVRGRRDLRVHLGCGGDVRPGWVNIDLIPDPGSGATGVRPGLFIRHDLRAGLPLADESCSLIYSSHFLEHLEYAEALGLVGDCRRALLPGGVFRVALPDYARFFRAYAETDLAFFDLIDPSGVIPGLESGQERIIDYVSYMVFERGGHKHLYDCEKLAHMLGALGFRDVTDRDFDPTIDPPSELRKRYSFYMEGIK